MFSSFFVHTTINQHYYTVSNIYYGNNNNNPRYEVIKVHTDVAVTLENRTPTKDTSIFVSILKSKINNYNRLLLKRNCTLTNIELEPIQLTINA